MTNHENLKLVPIFAGLADAEIALIAEKMRKKTFAAKQQILWNGEEGDTLYIIDSGRVKVHCVTSSGTDVTFSILGPYQFFGELSLLDGAPRSADVTALETTQCRLLRSEGLRDALNRNPELNWRLLSRMAALIRAQMSSIESLATSDVTTRLAQLILQLTQEHGEPWEGVSTRKSVLTGVRITVKLTRSEIGTFIGASREHVTNIINEFGRLGYLTTDNDTGHIVILKPAMLERRASL